MIVGYIAHLEAPLERLRLYTERWITCCCSWVVYATSLIGTSSASAKPWQRTAGSGVRHPGCSLDRLPERRHKDGQDKGLQLWLHLGPRDRVHRLWLLPAVRQWQAKDLLAAEVVHPCLE